MATWQMCRDLRLVNVILAMFRALYGALTDEYDLASQMMSWVITVPVLLIGRLAWLVLSKVDVRMGTHVLIMFSSNS
jgi:hypothetical protein